MGLRMINENLKMVDSTYKCTVQFVFAPEERDVYSRDRLRKVFFAPSERNPAAKGLPRQAKTLCSLELRSKEERQL